MDPVGICNVALGLLGSNKISALSDAQPTSVEEETCASLFPLLRNQLLEEHAWLFATALMDLGAIVDPPVGEVNPVNMPNRYAKPLNTIAVRGVDDGTGSFELLYEIRGEHIVVGDPNLSDTPIQCYAVITQLKDVALWPATFCLALSYKLASLCAIPFTHNVKLTTLFEGLYERELAKASLYDGLQGTANQKLRVSSQSLSNLR